MNDSPSREGQGVFTLTLKSNGTEIDGSIGVMSVEVRRAVNAVPYARIEILDGDAATGGWPVSDGTLFAPGAVITVLAGYDGPAESIFEGRVVTVGIQAGDNGDGRLVVECLDQTVESAGAQRGAGPLGHGGKVSIEPADVDGTPVLKVEYGVDLLEFRAEIDARTQPDASASAPQAQARPPRASGHLRFQGSAKAVPGALVEVKGLGQRFSGPVLIVAVEHRIADGGWTTRAEFGLAPGGRSSRPDPASTGP